MAEQVHNVEVPAANPTLSVASSAQSNVRVVRVKRKRTEDPADSLLLRLKRNNTTGTESDGIEMCRVVFDPNDPSKMIQPSSSSRKRGREAPQETTQDQTLGANPPRKTATASRKRARPWNFTVGENTGNNTAGGQVAFVDLIREASKSSVAADAPHSDITCNGIPLDKFARMTIDTKTGFTNRRAPLSPTALVKKSKTTANNEDDDVYDYYALPASSTRSLDELIQPGVELEIENQYKSDDEDQERGASDSEDSNAEDYYQNDYPDEPSSGDDEYNEYGPNRGQYGGNEEDYGGEDYFD
eukprot:m.262622 g.262622  ORF g.262622 m.262622 type:complete len:300 (-) comp46449_c0_seq1:50-949(-)